MSFVAHLATMASQAAEAQDEQILEETLKAQRGFLASICCVGDRPGSLVKSMLKLISIAA